MAVISIDLGMTNSLGAIFRNSTVELIPNRFGSFLTPSVVNILEDQTIITGTIAPTPCRCGTATTGNVSSAGIGYGTATGRNITAKGRESFGISWTNE